MLRGKRYLGMRARPSIPRADSSAISTISTASVPPMTSTPIDNEPEPRPSGILTERANVLPSQKPTSPKRVTIVANDDDIIPASQFVQPSRYTSQRSIRMRSQMMMSNTTQQTPLSYFESVLSRCGVELTARNSEISFTLNCDHLKFVIRLRKELSTHAKYPENVQTFLNGLIDNMKTQTQLIKVLSGCLVSKKEEIFNEKCVSLTNLFVSMIFQITLPNSNLSKTSQESLMNDFLMIDFMQKDIIDILMNKIKILSVEE